MKRCEKMQRPQDEIFTTNFIINKTHISLGPNMFRKETAAREAILSSNLIVEIFLEVQ